MLAPGLSLLLLTAAPVQPSPAAASYSITMELRGANAVLGTPTVSLAEGAETLLEVSGRYAMRVRANRLVGPGPVRVLVNAQVFHPAPSGWTHVGTADILAPLGQARSAPVRNRGGEAGALRVTVTRAPGR